MFPQRRSSGRRRSQDDTESRSSENSDHSSQRNTLQRLQAVSAAHHLQQQQQQQQHQYPDQRRISSPIPDPDAALASQDGSQSRVAGGGSVQDPNLSRLSRISGGSGANPDASLPGPIGRVDMLTSTPKSEPLGYRGRGSMEERGRWPESDRWYQDDQPKYAVPHQHNR